MHPRRRQSLWPLPLLLLGVAACTSHSKLPPGLGAYRVSFSGSPDLGTELKPLPFSASTPTSLSVDIDALTYQNGAWVTDESHDGYAVVTVQPNGKLAEDPQVVFLSRGRARAVKVGITMAAGPVRLVVVDPGYNPAQNPALAACNANGLDDDGDGIVDYPKDRGCYAAGDDSEEGGTASTGASPVISFANPRLADIQTPGKVQDKSALEGVRASVDQGFMLVTRVATDGLYVTDFDGVSWDEGLGDWKLAIDKLYYRSVFAFNYSAPRNVLEGDCLVQLDGTVMEFYNYTELSMPTWKKGDLAFCAAVAQRTGLLSCNPQDTDPAKISACRLKVESLANTPVDITTLLVDLPGGGGQVSVWDPNGVQTERFEGALVQIENVEMFTELRRCDRNGNGVVDFTVKEEADCSNDCGDDPGCVIGETYDRYHQWTVHFVDGTPGMGITREVTVSSIGTIPKFDPIEAYNANKGRAPKKLGKLVGTLRDLSFGRPRWTIETRQPSDCPDCQN